MKHQIPLFPYLISPFVSSIYYTCFLRHTHAHTHYTFYILPNLTWRWGAKCAWIDLTFYFLPYSALSIVKFMLPFFRAKVETTFRVSEILFYILILFEIISSGEILASRQILFSFIFVRIFLFLIKSLTVK